MTLKVRRILSLIFVIFFLIIAPVMILYAAGYQLKKNSLAIERTGIFIIDSQPRGAKIFLNGQAQKTWLSSLFNQTSYITTPAKIKDLLPGEYDLSLELNGYYGWHKKLIINPGASTFAEDIYLFKNGPPQQIAPAKIQTINFSPANDRALIISGGQMTIFNLADETSVTSNQKNIQGKNIAWSADGQRLVVDNLLFDSTDLHSVIDLSKLTPGAFNYKWSNNVLFYQDKASIYQLDNDNLPKKIINNVEFSDYSIKDGNLYLISQSKAAASLKVIDLSLNEQIKDISLPSANYSFINPEQTMINLYDNDHEILYLINPLAAYYPIVDIINNLKTARWYDGNNLLYTNDFEIWLYNLDSRHKALLTRISDTIIGAVRHPTKNYIIYATGQAVYTIELDERDKRNISQLVKFDSIKSFTLNNQGNILYFSGQIGKAEGLYKFLLQ